MYANRVRVPGLGPWVPGPRSSGPLNIASHVVLVVLYRVGSMQQDLHVNKTHRTRSRTGTQSEERNLPHQKHHLCSNLKNLKVECQENFKYPYSNLNVNYPYQEMRWKICMEIFQ